MKLIQDPRELKSRIREEEADWAVFFKTLRLYSSRELDAQILPTAASITEKTNCRDCAACCMQLEAGLSENEVNKLAAIKNQHPDEFIAQETAREHATGTIFLAKKPCIFLERCDCSIYGEHPAGCRDFPGLERPGVKYRIRRLFQHMEICPIIYNTFNTLRHQHQN